MSRPQSDFAHITCYPADKPRFVTAVQTLRAEMKRTPIQADLVSEMLDVWAQLIKIRDTITAADGVQMTTAQATAHLVHHWETT